MIHRVIVWADEEPPLYCQPLGKRVPGARAVVMAILPNATDVIHAGYGHLDRIDVKKGETVHVGDIVGTSGNTGCSTSPHLHFSVARVRDGREVMVDPYGWHSQLADPWAVDARAKAYGSGRLLRHRASSVRYFACESNWHAAERRVEADGAGVAPEELRLSIDGDRLS